MIDTTLAMAIIGDPKAPDPWKKAMTARITSLAESAGDSAKKAKQLEMKVSQLEGEANATASSKKKRKREDPDNGANTSSTTISTETTTETGHYAVLSHGTLEAMVASTDFPSRSKEDQAAIINALRNRYVTHVHDKPH